MTNSIQFAVQMPEYTLEPLREALKDLPRIADLVVKDTGWNLSGVLPVRVVNSEQACASMKDDLKKKILPVIKDTDTKAEKTKKQQEINTLEKNLPPTWPLKLLNSIVMGAYLPSRHEVIINNRSRNESLTADYYRSVIYHELIHVAQHQHHPELFTHVDRIAKKMIEDPTAVLLDRKAWKSMRSKTNSCMTLVEGQPFHLQKINDKEYFPDKNKSAGLRNKLIKCCLLMIPGVSDKIDQYSIGADFFKSHSAQAPETDQYFKPEFAETQFS